MTHPPAYLNDLPETSTRPSPIYQARNETNRRPFQLFGDSSTGALESRLEELPPPYRSLATTPIHGRTEVTEDTPELLQRLKENARMLPFLWKEHWDAEFVALPQEEKQRLIDKRAALRKREEEREKRREEAIDRILFILPTGCNLNGLFAVPKDETPPARIASPNLDPPTSTETRKRKRETGNNSDSLAPSDFSKPGSRTSKRARTKSADIQLNSVQNNGSQDESFKNSVRPDERVPSTNAVAEPPSAPSNSFARRLRKPRTACPVGKAKPLTVLPLRRSARIVAMRSRKMKPTEPSKPSKSSKGRKKREAK